ncbi:F0F1 ATP synthase subunit delta [[Mycoplasma] falconis]|uniref:ATP synthase subunit delta n=1 Tax=[Mycoplasma] falconis TaxID=92403 RepID=A0A501XCC8_9BACT|nr:F0F1 ATP synthase subunit delta [[Mycoplasma] falconis]TPE58099.1 F0F1 ATP synthase subunit delta [[Mycoplasma] falconis]
MTEISDLIYNWSFALYDLARTTKEFEMITNDAADIVRALKANPDYLNILNSYDVDDNKKYESIDMIFGSYHVYLVNTIKLATKRHVIKYMIKILNKFVELSNDKLNIKYGTIFTTIPLDENEIKKFETQLSTDLKSHVHLVNQIDNDLVAGIKIKVDDYIIDNSIQGQLDKIKQLINK